MSYERPRTRSDSRKETAATKAVVVETNNFHEVLKHFNEDGQLKDESTQFSIPCAICLSKNLSIPCRGTNLTLEVESHEPYAVLSKCGHGFGYVCLYNSLVSYQSRGEKPQCPFCREPVEFFHRRHFRLPALFLGRERREDIRRIRATLAADGSVDSRSIDSILDENDLETLPDEERLVLLSNFPQLGTEEEVLNFLTTAFTDQELYVFVNEYRRRERRGRRRIERG